VPPGVQLLLPAALPATAALLTWAAGAVGLRFGRVLAAISAWASLAILLVLWVPGRGVQEMHGLALGSGASLGLRLDAVSFAFCLAILVPSALLLTFQRRGWRSSGAAALTLAAALLAVLADSVVLMALFLGTAGTLLLVQLRTDHERGTEAYWPAVIAGWLCLLWAGATLEVVSSTSVYAAVPVAALGTPAFLLLAAAALLTSGLVPWRPWTAEMWDRPRLVTGSFAIAVMFPLGPAILLRAYALGGGRWPSIWLNLGLAVVGLATAVTAAARAQQAPTRRAHRAEVIPGLGGVALMALGLGTPVGVVAAVTAVLAASVLAALLPLLPEDSTLAPAAGLAVAAGVPPALTFVARLLAIQAALEAGDAWAFLGIGLGLSWLVSAAAAARALRLPGRGRGAEASASLPGATLAGITILVGGALAGVLVAGIAVPAVAEVMTFPVGAVSGGPLIVATLSGAWAAVALGAPVAVLLLGALAAGLTGPERSAEPERPSAAGRPFFEVPWAGEAGRLVDSLGRLRIPEQYQSLVDPIAVEAAMARGQPVLWAVLLLVLAVAVNR
jgi:hypothetical protein